MLSEAGPQRWIRLSYNVWCHYRINLLARVQKYFPVMAGIIKRMDGAIPSMHVHNHLAKCQYQWAFKYIHNSGQTMVKWSRQPGPSRTRPRGAWKRWMTGTDMTPLMTLWDIGIGLSFTARVSIIPWCYIENLPFSSAATISCQYEKAVPYLATCEKTFKELSERFGSVLIAEWESMEKQGPRAGPECRCP